MGTGAGEVLYERSALLEGLFENKKERAFVENFGRSGVEAVVLERSRRGR